MHRCFFDSEKTIQSVQNKKDLLNKTEDTYNYEYNKK